MVFLRRKIYKSLKKSLNQKEISLILGPRQAGKTTLMRKLIEELETEGKKSLYFNLDIIEDRQYFETQHHLVNRIKKEIGEERIIVFIDEIQRLKNAGLFLKGLYDLETSNKFVVSGSGSLELKSNLIEPLTGRKILFHCSPLSFSEFCANGLNIDFVKIENTLDLNPYEKSRLVNEYLIFGGYPRVVLAQTYETKTQVLKEIYQSYLEKDVQLLMGIENEESFSTLVKMLASQVGNIINRAELSSSLGVTEKTIKKYLFLLEKTFIIKLIKPYFQNVRKELKKSPKVYFLDLGLLRFAQGKISLPSTIEGSTFENACCLRLLELGLLQEIKFWRTQGGAEVDFIITSPKTGKPIPLEVKTVFSGKTIGRSLLSFLARYHPDQTFIYTVTKGAIVKRKNYTIDVIPYSHLPNI